MSRGAIKYSYVVDRYLIMPVCWGVERYVPTYVRQIRMQYVVPIRHEPH
jgi:hypothetical protein